MPHRSKFLPPTQQEPIPLEKNAQSLPRNNFQEIPYQLDTYTDTEQNSPIYTHLNPCREGKRRGLG